MKRKTKKKPVRLKSVRLAGKDFVWEPVYLDDLVSKPINPAFIKPATEQEIASALSRAVQAEHSLGLARNRIDQLIGERDKAANERDMTKAAATDACLLLTSLNCGDDWIQEASTRLGDWWHENREKGTEAQKRELAARAMLRLTKDEREAVDRHFQLMYE